MIYIICIYICTPYENSDRNTCACAHMHIREEGKEEYCENYKSKRCKAAVSYVGVIEIAMVQL